MYSNTFVFLLNRESDSVSSKTVVSSVIEELLFSMYRTITIRSGAEFLATDDTWRCWHHLTSVKLVAYLHRPTMIDKMLTLHILRKADVAPSRCSIPHVVCWHSTDQNHYIPVVKVQNWRWGNSSRVWASDNGHVPFPGIVTIWGEGRLWAINWRWVNGVPLRPITLWQLLHPMRHTLSLGRHIHNDSDTNHNANPTNPNTRYRCEYGTLYSMFALFISKSCGRPSRLLGSF